jgi:hypothetical protein
MRNCTWKFRILKNWVNEEGSGLAEGKVLAEFQNLARQSAKSLAF